MAVEELEKEVMKLKRLFEGRLKRKGITEMPYYATEGMIGEDGIKAKGHYFGIGLASFQVENIEERIRNGVDITHYSVRMELESDKSPIVIEICDGNKAYKITRREGLFGVKYDASPSDNIFVIK